MRLAVLTTLLAALLTAPLGAATASAGEPVVFRDEWRAWWRGSRKVGWEVERIEERPEAGPEATRFVVVERGWHPVQGGQVAWEERTEVGRHGRVLRHESRLAGPWGETRCEAIPAAGGLRWRAQVRELLPVEGTITEEVWSPAVVALLVLRGEQPAGKRSLRALDLPGPGSDEEELEVRREPDGSWRVTWGKGGRHVRQRGADGRLLRGEDLHAPGERLLPAGAAEAADPAQATPAEAPAALEAVELAGLTLRRPGPDWQLLRAENPPLLGAEHPLGLVVLALRLQVALPAAEPERLRTAENLRRLLNPRMKRGREGFELGPAAAVTWRERPAVRFAVVGEAENAPVLGSALLLPDPAAGGAVLVISVLPVDQALARAGELEQAGEALSLGGAGGEWRRVRSGLVSFEVPGAWQALAGGDGARKGEPDGWRSALGASQVRVLRQRFPAGADLRDMQTAWFEAQRQNENLAELELESHEQRQVDGRQAQVMVLQGRLQERQGVASRVRMASVATALGNGTTVIVVVVAFDLDWELGGVDRVVESLRWVEEH